MAGYRFFGTGRDHAAQATGSRQAADAVPARGGMQAVATTTTAERLGAPSQRDGAAIGGLRLTRAAGRERPS